MAFKDSLGRFAQSAVSKSKEMAETTRLNLEINNIEQKVREVYVHAGEYLMNNPQLLPDGDETVAQHMEALNGFKERLEQARQQLLEVRNVNICSGCGAEVNRSSKFCDRCGAAMDRSILEQAPAQPQVALCPSCGAQVDNEAVFCGGCGAKLKE